MCDAKEITKPLVDTWQTVSKPFVDTPVGRTAVNVATGGAAAPWMAAYDMANGADPTKTIAKGVAGYYGGEALKDMVGYGSGGEEGLGNLWGPEDMPPTAWQGDLPTSVRSMGATGGSTGLGPWDSPVPLEGTVGASMDTTGLDKVGEQGYLSRMMGGAQKAMGDAWSPEGIGKSLGNMGPMAVGAGLLDMFSKKKEGALQRERYNEVKSQMDNMYAPGSPEYKALEQELARADARAGRNSQIGQRSVDLAARIAKIKADYNASTMVPQNAMFNSSISNSGSGLSSLFAQWQKANTPRSPYNIMMAR